VPLQPGWQVSTVILAMAGAAAVGLFAYPLSLAPSAGGIWAGLLAHVRNHRFVFSLAGALSAYSLFFGSQAAARWWLYGPDPLTAGAWPLWAVALAVTGAAVFGLLAVPYVQALEAGTKGVWTRMADQFLGHRRIFALTSVLTAFCLFFGSFSVAQALLL
jgi:hypothetical protein